MDSSSQVAVLQKDVQELEQMNSSLLERVSHLERELSQAQSMASEAETQTKLAYAERDELRKRLCTVSEEHRLLQERTSVQSKEGSGEDLRSALFEIERFEGLLRAETKRRTELEDQLALRQKLDVENGLSHSLEVSELERMNTMLAAQNASLQENIQKMQNMQLQPSAFYKPEISAEPCAEPEQDDSNTARDSLTKWYLD